MKVLKSNYFLGILIILLNIIVNLEGCKKCTTKFERTYEKLLSRKKRYLVFPTGSNVLVSFCLAV